MRGGPVKLDDWFERAADFDNSEGHGSERVGNQRNRDQNGGHARRFAVVVNLQSDCVVKGLQFASVTGGSRESGFTNLFTFLILLQNHGHWNIKLLETGRQRQVKNTGFLITSNDLVRVRRAL